jgi:hypothetical protein
MGSDPHPHEVGTILDGKRAVVETYSRRPIIADPLELQRWVAGILLEELEVLARELLNFFRERIESLPELRCRPMHLQVSQLSLSLCCFDFLPQEV